MPVEIESLLAEHGDFRQWCHSLWANFAPRDRFPLLQQRFQNRLADRQPAEVVAELDAWRRCGILPEPDLQQQEWIGQLWSSWLYLELVETIGFTPGQEVDLRDYLPKAYPSLAYFGMVRTECHYRCQKGHLAEGWMPYWQVALKLQAPQLYLTPFLPEAKLRGCDLACGWGRICLALPDYSRLEVVACDLSEAGLQRLRSLARRRGVEQHLHTRLVRLPELPFEDDSFDFFLAFDIFEHLTNGTLDRLLAEILRCARPGSVLYAEIPLLARCPALTHVQHWTAEQVVELFQSHAYGTKRFQRKLWSPLVPEHFSFAIESGEEGPVRG